MKIRFSSQLIKALPAFLCLAFTPALGFAQSASACSPPDTSWNTGSYKVMTNYWNQSTCPGTECVTVNTSNGNFGVTEMTASCSSVAAYPAIYYGCHYGNCSPGTNLPIQVSKLQCVNSNWTITTTKSGVWDAAYDIWFCTGGAGSCTSGYDGAELMIWVDYLGASPLGSQIATNVSLGGRNWNVWEGRITSTTSWNVISYEATTKFDNVSNLNILSFIDDAVSRGYINSAWYLHAVEAGIEITKPGVPFTSSGFTVTVNNGCGTPVPTATPTATACISLFNGCNSATENGTWAGGNATRTFIAGSSAPAGANTEGTTLMKVAAGATTAAWNNGLFNLSGFSPDPMTGWVQLSLDLYVDAGVTALWGGYHTLSLVADSSANNLYSVAISSNSPTLNFGEQHLTFNLDYPASITSSMLLSNLYFVLSAQNPVTAGNFYVDNIRLVNTCGLPTVTATPTLTTTPCASLFNGCETMTDNGTWDGANATRSIVTSSTGAPAGMPSQGNGCMKAQVTTPSGYNNALFNLSGFAPTDFYGTTRISMDLYADSALISGSYNQMLLFADSSPNNLFFQGFSSSTPSVVAGKQTLVWNVDYQNAGGGASSITSGMPITKLYFVYNTGVSTALGNFYVDNIQLLHDGCIVTHTPVPTATSTRTFTNTPTPTSTNTSRPTFTNTPTLMPSNTPTGTATSTATSTATNSLTSTRTNTPVNTPTASTTATPTPSLTATSTATRTSTRVNTPTNTPSNSPSATNTATSSSTNTSTPTKTQTPTPTFTSTTTNTLVNTPTSTYTNSTTPTATNSLSSTPTATRTNTPANTSTNTPTLTPANTATSTATTTSTSTASSTRTATFTATSTDTNSATATASMTPTASLTASFTATPSATASPSPTHTATNSATLTATNSSTSTASATPTSSATRTDTPSATSTASNTDTSTITSTPTNSQTGTLPPTGTYTNTGTPTRTSTPSNTPSNTPTLTPTNTATLTGTSTATLTATATTTSTATSTATHTRTNTATATDSSTATPTDTLTATLTATNTPVDTATPPHTSTASVTTTPSATSTSSVTPTLTPTDSTSPTSSATLTATPSVSPTSTLTSTTTASSTPSGTPTNSPTGTVPQTNTPTASSSSTPTGTATLTPTNSSSPTGTPSRTPTPTSTASSTPSSTPSFTASSTATAIVISTSTNSPTGTLPPTNTATNTLTHTPTVPPTATATPAPTNPPTLTPTVPLSATPPASPTATSTVNAVSTPTGTPKPVTTVVIGPNPATGTLVNVYVPLVGPAPVRVEIFTIAFRKVLDESFYNVQPGDPIPLELKDRQGTALADGIYYVVVTTGGHRYVVKLLAID